MKFKFLFSISLCLSLFLSNHVEAATIILDPIGSYQFTVSGIPDQPDLKGIMVVRKDGVTIKVQFSSSVGEIALSDAKLDGRKLTGKIEVEGVVIKLNGSFSENGFEGQWNTEFGTLAITATKK